MTRRAVPGYLPAVIEHHARTGGGGPAGEHPDLIGVRACVEVATDNNRLTAGSDFLHELDQLSHLALTEGAGVQGVVEHHREQLDGPALTVDGDVHDLASAIVVFRAQCMMAGFAHRPSADQAEPRQPVFLNPVAHEVVVRQPESSGDPAGLA